MTYPSPAKEGMRCTRPQATTQASPTPPPRHPLFKGAPTKSSTPSPPTTASGYATTHLFSIPLPLSRGDAAALHRHSIYRQPQAFTQSSIQELFSTYPYPSQEGMAAAPHRHTPVQAYTPPLRHPLFKGAPTKSSIPSHPTTASGYATTHIFSIPLPLSRGDGCRIT